MDITSYVRSKQIELACTLESKKAIYLDIKFWIILRDIMLGLRTDSAELKLLSMLRGGVAEGKLFCPISDSTFVELLKKADVKSRSATASLMDELSLGITLIPYESRARTELAHFLHSSRSTCQVHPLDHLVWSKLSYVMGFVHPHRTGLDETTELTIQKGFTDHLWNISVQEMIERLGGMMLPLPGFFEAQAQRLNVFHAQHAAELQTFEQTYDIELHGMLDLFNDFVIDIVNRIVWMEHSDVSQLTPEQRQEQGKRLHNLLFTTFKRDETRNVLATIHIMASLYAAVRWNKQRQLKPNDFLDFKHATAALGYCDAFFTERSLRSTVTASHIALDQRYACHVVDNPQDAVMYLRELPSPS